MRTDWNEIARRVANGEDLEALLDEAGQKDREDFDTYLRHELGRPDLADRHAKRLREIDLGIDGARNTWSALSPAQRRVMLLIVEGTRRIVRTPHAKARYGMMGEPHAVGDCAEVRTIRNLCSRDLLAWDGGAFDPEKAAVLTERGRFMVKVAADDAQAPPPES